MIPTTDKSKCAATADCLSADIDLLVNVRQGLIDPDTPASVKTRTSNDGKQLNLVVGRLLPRWDLFTDYDSFLTNSILTDALSTREMIHFSRVWTSGTV